MIGKLYRISKTSEGLVLWLPAKIVKKLGLKPGDRMLIIPHNDTIQLVPLSKLLQTVKGV